MRKTLLFLFLGFMGCVSEAVATRPMRQWFGVRQSDGTLLEVQKQGNGHFVFYTTKDGAVLTRGSHGDLEYAVVAVDGLRSTGFVAHESELRSDSEKRLLAENPLTTEEAYQWMSTLHTTPIRYSRVVEDHDGLGQYKTSGTGIVKSIGAPTIPVIMVSFPNRDFMEGTTPEKVGRMLNESGYKDEKFCKGSVRDYFVSQSSGLFTPTFEVVANVKVANPYEYYGANYANGSIDAKVGDLIKEALSLAHEQKGIDFSKYVSEGSVPLISVYYAGPGEHSSYETGSEDYIWAHFSERSFNIDSVRVSSYFVGNEVLQDYKLDDTGELKVAGSKFDGIGVFVHEFGHALGLPDFYNTGTGKFMTMDYWSVMDYGQYFYDGYAPIGYNAFERSVLGWLDVKELKEAQYAELYPYGQEDKGATAYCIRNSANSKEYYLLENRQPGTWYPKLTGHGMFITHVDYDLKRWVYNSVNTEKDHQRFSFVPADNQKVAEKENGKTDWDGFKADLFPGLGNVTSLTDTTEPAMDVFTGGKMSKPIYNIRENGDVISFSFMDRSITGLDKVTLKASEDGGEVYTLSGCRVADVQHLIPGIYLVKLNGKVKKVYVK